MITDHQLLRYDRQITLRGFDIDRQIRLLSSHMLIAGVGGLGCAAATQLVAAGAGHIILADPDQVSLFNLPRQHLFSYQDIGRLKVEAAGQVLNKLNPGCQISTIPAAIEDNPQTQQLISVQQVVIDCCDNLPTRELLNRLCYQAKVPLISGAALRMEGQVMVFNWQPAEPSYRCLSRLYGPQNTSCSESGVMPPLPVIIGALQAMKAIKNVTAFVTQSPDKLVLYDALQLQFREFKVIADLQCEICGSSQ